MVTAHEASPLARPRPGRAIGFLTLAIALVASGCIEAIVGPGGPMDLAGTWRGRWGKDPSGNDCKLAFTFGEGQSAPQTNTSPGSWKLYEGTWTWLQCVGAFVDETGRSGEVSGGLCESTEFETCKQPGTLAFRDLTTNSLGQANTACILYFDTANPHRIRGEKGIDSIGWCKAPSWDFKKQ